MNDTIQTDICVIGAGAGGLCVASACVQMGAKVVLIEKNKMGGDCLNYGCVPSKSLIAAAKSVSKIKSASKFGVHAHVDAINMQEVHDYVKGVIASIEPHDSVERFESLGCQVFKAEAKFVSENQVKAGNTLIQYRYCIIATGAKPNIPQIEGLDQVPYHTNESVFDIHEKVSSLAVIGGGVVGLEIAQAYAKLETQTHVFSRSKILREEEEEIKEIIFEKFREDHLHIHESKLPIKVRYENKEFILDFEDGTSEKYTQLLLAVGRKPNIDLDLEKAHIKSDGTSIIVGKNLRTSNKKVYAIGDVRGGEQFTHKASSDASVVIQNILFKIPSKSKEDIYIPKVTFTCPEIAKVGYGEKEAIEKFGKDHIKVLTRRYSGNDRARCEGETKGFLKVIVQKNGTILGVHIIGEIAGELLNTWMLAIENNLKIKATAKLFSPYPTYSELIKSTSSNFYKEALYSEKVKKIVRFLIKL